MKLKILAAAFLLAALPAFAQTAMQQAPTQWVLVQSTLSYHMSHPLHQVDGVSHAAKGKGVCSNGECNFLIAAPVKSFNSGDSNRDLHMLEATRGADFPMVVVRAHFPQSELSSSTIYANLDVQFAGQTAPYTHVAFERTAKGSDMRIVGTVPSTCSDFRIVRPSFLGIPIANEIPVHVDAIWHSQ
ncbi:MAG: hypothetical protein ACRD27_10055 [Terracidiphilus sp.]